MIIGWQPRKQIEPASLDREMLLLFVLSWALMLCAVWDK
jgi:hypothetical protein